jgi:hypothetical protein
MQEEMIWGPYFSWETGSVLQQSSTLPDHSHFKEARRQRHLRDSVHLNHYYIQALLPPSLPVNTNMAEGGLAQSIGPRLDG